MKARGMILAVALLLAASATLVVYLYLNGVRSRAASTEMTAVVVSEQDIPAGTEFDTLISEGAFTTRRVPEDALVEGAVTDLSDLKDRESSAAIAAGEQITTSRLRGSQQLPGGSLGIPDGYQAVTLPLEAPRVAGGVVQRGDNVSIYGTFTNVASSTTSAPAATVTLVPTVEVLSISRPQEGSSSATMNITLALTPRDSAKVVFAQEQGSVYLALLPPDQKGSASRPVNALQLVR